MLEHIPQDILCKIVAAEGWDPSLIAAIAPLSHHMSAMARTYLWPAYCFHWASDATQSLLEEDEGFLAEREACGMERGSYAEDMDWERDGDTVQDGGGRSEWQEDVRAGGERGNVRGTGRVRVRDEPPGGWISLAKLITVCHPIGQKYTMRDQLQLYSSNLWHKLDKKLTRVIGGEGIFGDSADVIFQSAAWYHMPPCRGAHFSFRGIVRDFQKSRVRQNLMEQKLKEIESEQNNCKTNKRKREEEILFGGVSAETFEDIKCFYCNAEAWDVTPHGNSRMFVVRRVTCFMCCNGHFAGVARRDNPDERKVARKFLSP